MSDIQGRNHELKAHEPDLLLAAQRCAAIGVTLEGPVLQTDTYSNVTRGKLKLREYQHRTAELFQYQRLEGKAKLSDCRVVTCTEPAVLWAAPGDALGVLLSVRKTRQLFLWRGVRIQLDTVADLGTFIEAEARITDGSAQEAAILIKPLRASLKIIDQQLVTDGYADQLTPETATTADLPTSALTAVED